MITARCPECMEDQKVDDNLSGQEIKCEKCSASFNAPVVFRGPKLSSTEESPKDSYSSWRKREFLDRIIFFVLLVPLVFAGIYGLRTGRRHLNGQAAHEKAQEMLNQERWDEAIEYAEDAIARNRASREFKETLGQIHFARGKSLDNAGEYDAAIDSLILASRILTDDPVVIRRLAFAHLHAGNRANAINYFRHILSLVPDAHESRYQLAVILAETGNFSEASREFQIIIDAQPQNYRARYAHAVCMDQLGNSRSALELLRALLRDNPGMREAEARVAAIAAREEERKRQLSEVPDFTFEIVEENGFVEQRGSDSSYYVMYRFRNTSGRYFTRINAFISYYGFDNARKVLLHKSGPITLQNISVSGDHVIEDRVHDSNIAERIRTTEINLRP